MEPNEKNAAVISRIKALRREISALIKNVEDNYKNDDMAITRVKLKEAKHWCGEYLKTLGSELPQEFRDDV